MDQQMALVTQSRITAILKICIRSDFTGQETKRMSRTEAMQGV